MQETKKGGPYNKIDQDSRRNEVQRLHFEYGYSARKIAAMMKINRNTINADIKEAYSNIKEDIKEEDTNFVLKQIGRLEAQRNRIVENLRENNIDGKIKYEKLLLEIDSKINSILSRVNAEPEIKEVKEKDDENQEGKIRELVLFLIIKYSKDPSIIKEHIISEIVNIQRCTINDANKTFSHMEKLGLECCRKFRNSTFIYNLLEFAYLRRYLLPSDPFVTRIHELCFIHNHFDAQKMELKQEFRKEHGNKEKWTDKIFEQYATKQEQNLEKYAESSSKIITEALEKLSNQEKLEEYLSCINVFFGKEEKPMFERMAE